MTEQLKSSNRVIFWKLKQGLIAFFFTLISTVCNSQNSHREEVFNTDSLEQVIEFSGRLMAWAQNENFVYGGFYLKACNEKYTVVFSPYLGHKFKGNLKVNDIVSITGIEVVSNSGEKIIKLISLITEDEIIYDILPEPAKEALSGKLISGSAKIIEFQKSNSGKMEGIILTNKIIIRMPVPFLELIDQALPVGTKIYYTGQKIILPASEEIAKKYTIISCYTITIKGKNYFIR